MECIDEKANSNGIPSIQTPSFGVEELKFKYPFHSDNKNNDPTIITGNGSPPVILALPIHLLKEQR